MISRKSVNNTPSIGIIIPVYNGEDTITRCIQSVKKQTYRNFYLYIINDGSTDETSKELDRFSNDTRIHIINQKNHGVSAARNRGIDEANTDYIAFIDSDDYVEKDYLKNLISEYISDHTDLVISGYKILLNNTLTNVHYSSTGVFKAKDIINIILQNNGPQGFLWNKLWKKEIIDNNNLRFSKNIKMAEDLLFTVEYVLKCKKIVIKNNNDYIYNLDHGGLVDALEFNSSNNNFDKAFSDYLTVLQEIKAILKDNNLKIDKINSQLGIVSTRYLRLIGITTTSTISKKQRNLLKKDCIKYRNYVFRDKEIPLKTKCAYVLNLYFPIILQKLDKKSMRSSNEYF